MPVWWVNTCSRTWRGYLLRLNMPVSSATATPSWARIYCHAISQSGETADTLAAIELAKSRGATIIGICNVVGSSIARVTHAGSYTHAGPEIGVASTKAMAQVTVLTLMALMIGRRKGTISASNFHRLINELDAIPDKVQKVLQSEAQIKYIADIYKDAPNALYLGRGYSFPVALEGALKLKEISYIH